MSLNVLTGHTLIAKGKGSKQPRAAISLFSIISGTKSRERIVKENDS